MRTVSQDRKFLSALRKIEIFDGLSAEQARKILNICEVRQYRAQQRLCNQNAPSTEMFILLSGALEIHLEEGTRVGSVQSGECVGEMGVLTEHPRSATVMAAEDSMVLVIRKSDLKRLITRAPDVGVLILNNVVQILIPISVVISSFPYERRPARPLGDRDTLKPQTGKRLSFK